MWSGVNILFRFFIIMLFLTLPLIGNTQIKGVDYQWTKRFEKDGIEVFNSKVPGSAFIAVRGKAIIQGNIKSLVALLEDIENCSNWASLCKKVSLVKYVSRTEYFVYILNAVTFPIADRDLIAHITWNVDPETKKVTMYSEATKQINSVAKPNGVVRLDYAITQWSFTPLSGERVLVENYAHVDPNGAIPSWIINRLSKRAPYRSILKIRKSIEAGEYDNKPTHLFDGHCFVENC